MALNKGKQFEQKFKEDMLKIDGVSLDRLPDQWNGLKNSSNICDFVVYKFPSIFYIELKSHNGNTFPFANLRQYDKLLSKSGIKGVHPVVILWFIDYDAVYLFPIESIKKMKDDGNKSINIRTCEQYDHLLIPSIKRRVFLDSNYKEMFDYFYNIDMENS